MVPPSMTCLSDTLYWVVMLPRRFMHRRRQRVRSAARSGAIESIRKTLAGAKAIQALDTERVFNVTLYVLLLDEDLAHCTDAIMYAPQGSKQRFAAKHEALLVYEAAEDLLHLLGRNFRSAAQNMGATEEQMNRFDANRSEINAFWRGNRVFLGTIRNALAAHREHDALKYLQIVEQLETLQVMSRAGQLSEYLKSLVDNLIEIARLTSNEVRLAEDVERSRVSAR